MQVLTTISEVAPFHGGVFVPTMGALHEGHASLVRQARGLADERGGHVVVSVFVNPTQFNDPGDLKRYPRTLEADAAMCEGAGADVVFAPTAEAVYPPDGSVSVPRLPAQATEPGLEDAHRPGHFAGVCQVVKRLFELVRPRAAVFGEKDWQQLQVVTAMSAGLEEPVEIVPGPIVREGDGLAMSSRNRFLTEEERVRAVGLIRALRAGQAQADVERAQAAMVDVMKVYGIEPEYAVVREARTLRPVNDCSVGGVYRALVAGKLGQVRLLDNASWPGDLSSSGVR